MIKRNTKCLRNSLFLLALLPKRKEQYGEQQLLSCMLANWILMILLSMKTANHALLRTLRQWL